MESKHTPGPWKITQTSYGSLEWLNIENVSNNNICRIWKKDRIAIHNAKLIAASPKLLEALKKCVALLETDLVTGGTYLTEYKIAKQAINEAEGE